MIGLSGKHEESEWRFMGLLCGGYLWGSLCGEYVISILASFGRLSSVAIKVVLCGVYVTFIVTCISA